MNQPLAGRAASLEPGIRVYAVGDVHGRLDLLRSVQAMIDADAAGFDGRVVEVMVGDYIDRGPDSAGVVQRLIERRAQRELVTLRGNHEDYLLQMQRSPEHFLRWCENGGLDTIASYGVGILDRDEATLEREGERILREFFAALPPSHLDFYRSTALSWRQGDYLFAHAGIRPGVPLEEQSEDDRMWIRRDFLDSHADHGVVVVHGHTPGDEPVIRPNRIGIDTRAYDSGRLTCLVLETETRRFLATG